MKLVFLAITLLLPASTLTSPRPPAARFPDEVSILQLIATPEKYDGKNISVVGFLRVEFEGNALYLHQEDYEHHIYKNSVWVSFEPKAIQEAKNLSMHYVFLVGTFDSGDKGHRAMASGSIKQIGNFNEMASKHRRREVVNGRVGHTLSSVNCGNHGYRLEKGAAHA